MHTIFGKVIFALWYLYSLLQNVAFITAQVYYAFFSAFSEQVSLFHDEPIID